MENYEDIVSPFSPFIPPHLTRRRSYSLFDSPAKLPKLNLDGLFNKLDFEFSNESNNNFEKHIHIYEQIAPTMCSYKSEFSLVENSTSDSFNSQADFDLDGSFGRVGKRIKKSKLGPGKLKFPQNLLQKLNVLKSKSKSGKARQQSQTEDSLESKTTKITRKLSKAQTVKVKPSSSNLMQDDQGLKLKLKIPFEFKQEPTIQDLNKLPLKPRASSFSYPGYFSSFPLNLEDLIQDQEALKRKYLIEEFTPKRKKSRRKNKVKKSEASVKVIKDDYNPFKRVLVSRKKSHLLNLRSNILISRLTDNLSEMKFISNDAPDDAAAI